MVVDGSTHNIVGFGTIKATSSITLSSVLNVLNARLYSELESQRPFFDFVGCPTVSIEENEWLQRPFPEEEVLLIINQSDEDKAPDTDDFTMDFFKKCWDILKEGLMLSIQNLHQRSAFEKSFNVTFIALIQNKPDAIELKSLRPISCL